MGVLALTLSAHTHCTPSEPPVLQELLSTDNVYRSYADGDTLANELSGPSWTPWSNGSLSGIHSSAQQQIAVRYVSGELEVDEIPKGAIVAELFGRLSVANSEAAMPTIVESTSLAPQLLQDDPWPCNHDAAYVGPTRTNDYGDCWGPWAAPVDPESGKAGNPTRKCSQSGDIGCSISVHHAGGLTTHNAECESNMTVTVFPNSLMTVTCP